MVIKRKNFIIGILILAAAVILAFCFNKAAASETFSETGETCSLPVVMYHSVRQEEKYSGKYVITPAQFEADLKYLAENGYTAVSVEELCMFVSGKGKLPPKPVLLTFDDGYYNNYLYVYPLLKQYNAKAVISPVGKFSELYSEEPQAAGYSHLSWDQVREMAQSGFVEIGNHSYNMHSADTRAGVLKKDGESESEYISAITEDIEKMQLLLKENSGVDCVIFAYPFGNYDKAGRECVEKMPFVCSLSCTEGLNEIKKGSSLQMLKRYNRPAGINSADFFESLK